MYSSAPAGRGLPARTEARHGARSDHRLRHPAPPRVHRAGDGRGHAAHRLLADPQLEPRLLHRGLRRPGPARRAGRARAHPRGRPALGGGVGGRLLQGAHRPGRPLPPQRSLSRQQSPARPHGAAARLRGRPAGVLVDQPRAPARHRRRDPRGLQPGRHRDLAGGHPHHPAQALRPRASCATTCCRWWRPTCGTRATSRATCGP